MNTALFAYTTDLVCFLNKLAFSLFGNCVLSFSFSISVLFIFQGQHFCGWIALCFALLYFSTASSCFHMLHWVKATASWVFEKYRELLFHLLPFPLWEVPFLWAPSAEQILKLWQHSLIHLSALFSLSYLLCQKTVFSVLLWSAQGLATILFYFDSFGFTLYFCNYCFYAFVTATSICLATLY